MDKTSYSVILEGVNLRPGDVQTLEKCLESLRDQGEALAGAREVVLMEAGHISDEAWARVAHIYPWLERKRIPSSTGYYEAKTAGLDQTTGDIVVFADSDNVYKPQWLESLLAPFQGPRVEIVTGETAVDLVDLIGFAYAVGFYFPRFSSETGMRTVETYFSNNVAFRRSCLQRMPIPAGLPLYRGNEYLHSLTLRGEGVTIWKTPRARAVHGSPASLGEISERFLHRGADRVALLRRPEEPLRRLQRPDTLPSYLAGLGRIALENAAEPFQRLASILREDPSTLKYVPAGIPLVLWLNALSVVGSVIETAKPGWGAS